MADKSPHKPPTKKSGKSLKEKRQVKKAKQSKDTPAFPTR